MKLAGRVSVLAVLAIFAVIVGGAVIVLLTTGESPESAATSFLSALAKGDINELTNLSYMANQSPEEVKKKWDFAENVAGPYYRFAYRVTGSNQADANDAVKVGDKWKVDVRSVNIELFPALPR
jgi:hypothetical protein